MDRDAESYQLGSTETGGRGGIGRLEKPRWESPLRNQLCSDKGGFVPHQRPILHPQPPAGALAEDRIVGDHDQGRATPAEAGGESA
jgi:hypothetical protein